MVEFPLKVMKAVMKEPDPYIYEFGEFRVDPARRSLVRGFDEVVALSPRVFDTLHFLVRNSGKVLEKEEMLKAIWTDAIVEENNLNQSISILRRVLGENAGENRFIETVPGRGFKFVADVNEIPESEVRSRDSEAAKKVEKHATRGKIGLMRQAGVAIAALISLSLLGVYLWRSFTPVVSEAPIRTVAVLPFKPIVPDDRNESLELGMTDTLISKLGNSGEIIVRPLSSVRNVNSLEQDPLAAGRRLKVDSILEGSIQIAGDRIRVSARLIHTEDGRQLWADQFNEKLTDIFSVQDRISERVASALLLQLDSQARKRLSKRYTENIEAYQLYIKGRYHFVKLSRSDIQTGIEYFQKAIEADPAYALAYAGLADANRALAIAGELDPNVYFPRAKAAAKKATEIDDSLAEAHAVLGYTIFWHDWDWRASEAQCRRALELDPNSADARLYYAHLLSNTGRHEEALTEARQARELDPLNLRTNTLEGQFLVQAGRPDEAISRLQETLTLQPDYWFAHQHLANAYIDKGMLQEAIIAARRTSKAYTYPTRALSFLGYALAKSGKEAEARDALRELSNPPSDLATPYYNIALIHSGLGERDEALTWLERALEARDPRMVFLKVDAKWTDLRSEPRFLELMRRMNFE